MGELLAGFSGALVGGVLAMVGSFFQSHLQAKESERQFERQRRLAEEEHSRRQVVIENERVRRRVDSQLAYGRKVMIAAVRFKAFASPDSDASKLRDILSDAVRLVGLDFGAPSPFPDFVAPIEIEDDELRDSIAAHRKIISHADVVLATIDAHPSELPNSHEQLEQVDDLARRIGVRCRVLQREGRPL
ncbi:MAG: hypothetical protein WD379_00365 [Dehalococcoidia bacterium]